MQLPAKYMFSLQIQFVATLSICGSVAAQHVLFLDTRGLGWANFVESAQERVCGKREGRLEILNVLRQLVAEFVEANKRGLLYTLKLDISTSCLGSTQEG